MEARDGDGDPVAFSIAWTTYDRNRGRGGETMYIGAAVLASSTKAKSENADPDGRAEKSRNAGHWRNYTRNIRRVGSGDIITIHPLLIDRINDQQVVL